MSDKFKVLVTGITGYVGSHLTWQLLERGYTVRGTVRNLESDKVLFLKSTNFHPSSPSRLELFEADLLTEAAWRDAMTDVRFVFHVASPFPLHPPKYEEELVVPAVQGTTHVIQAAIASGSVERIIVTSSCAAVTDGHPCQVYDSNRVFTEEDWSIVENCQAYAKSKTLAEKVAWELTEGKIDCVTLCPGLCIGPAFSKAQAEQSTSSAVIVNQMLREYNMAAPSGLPFIDVRDVAEAHVRAMELPRDLVVGKRFILSSRTLTVKMLNRTLKEEFATYDFHPATVEMPSWTLDLLAKMSTLAAQNRKRFGYTPLVSNVRMKQTLLTCPRNVWQSIIEHAYNLINLGLLPKRNVPLDKLYAPIYTGEWRYPVKV